MKKMNVEVNSDTWMFELEVSVWGKRAILVVGLIENCLAVLLEKLEKTKHNIECLKRCFKREIVRAVGGCTQRSFAFSDDDGCVFIVMPRMIPTCASDIADLAHECLHAADFMLKEEGVKDNQETCEVLAYTQAFILSKLLDAVAKSEVNRCAVAESKKPDSAGSKDEPVSRGETELSVQQNDIAEECGVEVFVLKQVDVWGSPVFLVVGPNERCADIVLKALPKDYAYADFLKKEFEDEVNPLMKNARSCGLQFCDDAGNVFMWMPSLDVSLASNTGILVHECLHAANTILRNVGVVDDQESKEVLAHTQQHILYEFLKMWTERTTKKLSADKRGGRSKGVCPKDEQGSLVAQPTPAKEELGNVA